MWADTGLQAMKIARYQDLLRTRREAGFLGRAGRPTAGYRCLLEGFQRAEAARVAGEAWGDDLVDRYLHALDAYAWRYHLLPPAVARRSRACAPRERGVA